MNEPTRAIYTINKEREVARRKWVVCGEAECQDCWRMLQTRKRVCGKKRNKCPSEVDGADRKGRVTLTPPTSSTTSHVNPVSNSRSATKNSLSA
jgi:hypothetical protein